MFRKKEVFTVITPIPGLIPRQLAIDILHSHSEVITLNPLVLDHKPIPAPRDVKDQDEYFSTWYEISQRIQYVPGIGKMGAGDLKFTGCFHNLPWGLQTHIIAPMGVDLRNKYIVAGNQTGIEAPQPLEIGLSALGAPADGLYLREEIEVKANITVVGFVKSQLQKAGGEMVRRIIKKAELLDAGVLQAMMQDGKLKTINPADRSQTHQSPSPLQSPTGLSHRPSPTASPPPQSPGVPYKTLRPESYLPRRSPGITSSQYFVGQGQSAQGRYGASAPLGITEPCGSDSSAPMSAPVEMPGDFYHPRQLSPEPSRSGEWAAIDSRPLPKKTTSASGNNNYSSAALNHGGFMSELPAHQEGLEEYRVEPLRKIHTRILQPSSHAPYNPVDYANVVEPKKCKRDMRSLGTTLQLDKRDGNDLDLRLGGNDDDLEVDI